MNALTRLKRLALRPLWAETSLQRARRRCRTLIATPFAGLGGLTWGVFAAPTIGVGSPILWGALGAVAFPLLMHLEQRVAPALSAMAQRTGVASGPLASVVWEAGVVGGLLYLLTRVLGAPVVPAVGTALGIGAFYAVVMEYVLCGSAAADIVRLIRGGGGSRRPAVTSHADALMKRGAYDEALAIYRQTVERNPREASGYVRLSRALVDTGDFEGAVETLRRGFVKAKLTDDQEAFIVRQIHEVSVSRLAAPATALPDLRLLIAHQPEGVHGAWARREVSDIEGGAYEERDDDR